MALQSTQHLAMTWLGVLQDEPVDDSQPRLVDGIHLRWSFGVDRSFPWYGYYLFRRPSQSKKPKIQCVSASLDKELLTSSPFPLNSTIYSIASGTFSSDRDLIVTDDFPDAGVGEMDLRNRSYVRFKCAEPVFKLSYKIGLRKRVGGFKNIKLVVRFFSDMTLLKEEVIMGPAGEILTGEYNSDCITDVEFTGGDAAIIDICYASILQNKRGGWKPLNCPQPLALPVLHPEYPASGRLAMNLAVSRNEARSRICYGNPTDWSGSRFSLMHEVLRELVSQGPNGPEMKDVGSNNVQDALTPPGSPFEAPKLEELRPMSYLVMSALHAPVAQMLGLYWADQTAEEGRSYDYLIIADHSLARGGPKETLKQFEDAPSNLTTLDAWICFNCQRGHPAPLKQPTHLRVYALPGGIFQQAEDDHNPPILRDLSNNAGLIWDLMQAPSGKLKSDSAVMYAIRRSPKKVVEPSAPIPIHDHQPISEMPHLINKPDIPADKTPERSSEWPNISFHYIDSGLEEGWYSYCVNGVDLFGRYSAASAPAAWYQWAPPPDPHPWYYRSDIGNDVVHSFAISLLDKIPPPAPTAVEAFVLDPKDPDVIRDSAYLAWFSTLSSSEKESVVGLRVRWLWTWSHMIQSTDTREFRIYWRSGQSNLFKGHINFVTLGDTLNNTPTNTLSTVTTDIAHNATTNAFQGCYLRTQNRSFEIIASTLTSPLQLVVKNVSPDQSIKPEVESLCSISIPPENRLYVDLSVAKNWTERSWVVGYDDNVVEGVIPATAPGNDEISLVGENATAAGEVITLPVGTDISAIHPWDFHLYLSEDTARPSRIYRITDLNPAARTLTLDGRPSLNVGRSGWELGVRTRRYEIFLPVAGDPIRNGVPLRTSSTQAIAYGVVGVTAVDDKSHTADDSVWRATRWGNRYGNEGRIGGPATVFRIHRTPPESPQMPQDADEVYASRADYHGKSYYTFRWPTQAGLETHIFRALDQSVFQTDWLIRSTRTALASDNSLHTPFFPETWNIARKNAVSTALNAIRDQTNYATLSTDAVEVLARLPGNEGHRSKGTLYQRDWLIRRTRRNLMASDTQFFPPDWTDALMRQQAADSLNAINSFEAYITLSNNASRSNNNALRILAGLPGNETAFQQVTHRSLSNTGDQTANRRGPDNSGDFPIDITLRAYIDALDGRSTNKYFYRAAFMDAAQNLSELSLSGPPVRVPDVLPPRAPVFTRVLAGDPDQPRPGDRDQTPRGNKKITLRWTSNREADLDHYLVYRTAVESNTRDLRLMDQIHTMPVPENERDPALRPNEITWVDDTVLGLVTYYYCLVAVDTQNNLSEASIVIAARAFDLGLPEVPALRVAWVEQGGAVRAEVSWNSEHEVMIQRKGGGNTWIDLAQWRPPGDVTIRDPYSVPGNQYQYRAWVRKYTGALKRGEAVSLEART